jgi:predicted DNA-binding transcriptional regulator AlpA
MGMTERLFRVPEVARALALDGPEVYALIDRGELKASKGPDGLVYVSESALEDYRKRRATAAR